MPGMLGRDVAARVEALRPGVGVLYMSGYSQGVIGAQGELTAGQPVIEKPFTAVALLMRVRDALSAARVPRPD